MKQINRYQVRRYIPLYHEDLDIVGMDGAYEALLAAFAVDQSPMGRVRRVLSQAGETINRYKGFFRRLESFTYELTGREIAGFDV